MMKTVSLDERILNALRGLIEHHSSSRCVAEQMGQAHNYVARILRGETKLRLDVLERILETLGVPHRFFMEMVLVDRPDDSDAIEILRFFCGDGPPTQDFLEDIQPTLDVLVRMPMTDGGDYVSKSDELDRLEELRRSDRDAAEEGLKMMVLEMLADPPVPVPRMMLQDMALALATYGTVQRFAGRRADSARSFKAAFQVAVRGGRPLGVGWVYRKSAYLVRDFGHCEAAIRFLERARERYLRAGETDLSLDIFVDRALFWMNMGEMRLAIQDYESGLEVLGHEKKWLRHVCFANLTHCYQEIGDLNKAFAAVEQAELLHSGEEDVGLAFLVKHKANLAAAVGEVDIADAQFRRAIELLSIHSEPIDVALCALDFADLLMSEGEPEAVRRLADDMLTWLPAFRGSRVADAVITELIRCAKWGELTTHILASARERLEKAQAA